MYQVRVYYKNTDENCKHKVLWHPYSCPTTFEQAYGTFTCFFEDMKNVGLDDYYCFVISMKEELIEPFTLELNKKNIELVTIVKMGDVKL